MSTLRRILIVAVVLILGNQAMADPRITQLIDDEINSKLKAERVISAGRADDSTLVRRIYLDILGRPPTWNETDDFLADQNLDKVHNLIGKLRLYPETAAHWRQVIAGWLQAGTTRSKQNGLLEYLANSIVENQRWDWIARDLMNPTSDHPRQLGAAEYMAHFLDKTDAKAGRDAATVAIASAFFGTQIQCARCHDHPSVPAWTKAHFDGFRAFFDRAVVNRNKLGVKLEDGPPVKGAGPLMFLDGKKFDTTDKPLAMLANYAIRPETTLFKRSIVNRVWKQLMGRGLVEPVDMIHDGNPASHPKLFDALANDFADNQFNFDRLVSSIMHSEAYLRSARWTGPSDQRPAEATFAVAALRPLSGPQMAWSVAVATGHIDSILADPRAEGLGLPRGKGVLLVRRYKWENTEDFAKLSDTFRGGGAASTASHAIYLSFDPFMSAVLVPKSGLLVGHLVNEMDDDLIVKQAYLAILCREPRPEEIAVSKEHVKAAKSRSAGCQDLAWALISSAEFRFNH